MPTKEAERRNELYSSLVGQISPGEEKRIPFEGEFNEDKFNSFARWLPRNIQSPPGYTPRADIIQIEGQRSAWVRFIPEETKPVRSNIKKVIELEGRFRTDTLNALGAYALENSIDSDEMLNNFFQQYDRREAIQELTEKTNISLPAFIVLFRLLGYPTRPTLQYALDISTYAENTLFTLRQCMNTLHLSSTGLRKRLNKIEAIPGEDSLGRSTNLYRLSEVVNICDDLLNKPQVDKETGEFIDQTGNSWAPKRWFVDALGIHETAMRNDSLQRVKVITGRDRSGNITSFFNTDDMLANFLNKAVRPIIDKNTSLYTHEEIQYAPLSWFKQLGLSKDVLTQLFTNLSFIDGRNERGYPTRLYKVPDAIHAVTGYLSRFPTLERPSNYVIQEQEKERNTSLLSQDDEIYVDEQGDEYRLYGWFYKQYGISRSAFLSRVSNVSVHASRNSKNIKIILYKVNSATEALQEITSKPQVDKEDHVFANNEGLWAPLPKQEELFGVSISTLRTRINSGGVRSIPGRDHQGHEILLYNVVDIGSKLADFLALPKVDTESGIYTDNNNRELSTISFYANLYNIAARTLATYIKEAPSTPGKDRRNRETELYAKEDVEYYLKNLLEKPQVNRNTREYVDDKGRWATLSTAKDRYNLYEITLKNRMRGKVVRTILGRDAGGHLATLYNLNDMESVLVVPTPINKELESEEFRKNKLTLDQAISGFKSLYDDEEEI